MNSRQALALWVIAMLLISFNTILTMTVVRSESDAIINQCLDYQKLEDEINGLQRGMPEEQQA